MREWVGLMYGIGRRTRHRSLGFDTSRFASRNLFHDLELASLYPLRLLYQDGRMMLNV